MNAALIARAGNDADIVEAFVRHHAELVDLLVILDISAAATARRAPSSRRCAAKACR